MSLTPEAAKRLAQQVLVAEDEDGESNAAGGGFVRGDAGNSGGGAGAGGGQWIGRYRVERLLGVGGMGEVHRAVQEHPRREVALKLVRPELVSAEVRRRFDHEARVLARLQHPGIAQIFDAGEAQTDAGPRPYFAMELVSGARLTEYAKERGLSVRQRLELFLKVCEAVEHAHRKGVIHRDLKPGNILVDAAGQPKVLDFGVARVTDGDVQVTTIGADVGKLVGTLPYMSPEQAGAGGGTRGAGDGAGGSGSAGAAGDGGDLDTRSDVYALGVVLYELLSGKLPYEVRSKSIVEAVRVIREEEARPLSSIDRVFRGDLETIVGKALEKERERRYQSVGELAGDVRRFLGDEPIVARRASAWYQVRKFARRHTGAVTASAAAMGALMAGTAVATWSAISASRAADRAVTAEHAEQTQRQLAEEHAHAAQEAAARAEAFAIFVRDMFAAINPAKGGRNVRVAEILDSGSVRANSDFLGRPGLESSVHTFLGEAYSQLGDDRSAEREFKKAVELRTAALGATDPETLSARSSLGACAHKLGDLARAESILREVLDEQVRQTGWGNTAALQTAAALVPTLLTKGDGAGALEVARRAYDAAQASLGDGHAMTLRSAHNLGGVLQKMGRAQEAGPYLQLAASGRAALLGEEHPDTVSSRQMLAGSLVETGHRSQAIPLFRQNWSSLRTSLGEDHPDTINAELLVGGSLLDEGNIREAEPLIRDVLERRCRVLGEEHSDALGVRNTLAKLLERDGRAADAESVLRDNRDRANRIKATRPDIAVFAATSLGEFYTRQHRYEEAEEPLESALAAMRQLVGDTHPRTVYICRALRSLYQQWDKPDKAEEYAAWIQKAGGSEPASRAAPR